MSEHHPIPVTTLLPAVGRLLAAGRCVRILAEGTSMLPALRPGIDSVTIAAPEGKKLRRLDILLALDPATGRYILHRVARPPRRGFVSLRGDANLVISETLPISSVIGVVTAIHRPGRPDASPRTFRARLWLLTRPLRRVLASLRSRILTG